MTVTLIDPYTKEWLTAPLGFSWTNMFFGFFVPLYRGENVFGFIYFVVGILTAFIFNIVMWFIYNKGFIRRKLRDGWLPATNDDKDVLSAYRIRSADSFAVQHPNDRAGIRYRPKRTIFYIVLVASIIVMPLGGWALFTFIPY